MIRAQVDDSTVRYIQMVRRIPRLTPREERDLFERYRSEGDRTAAERLLRAHLADVVFVALKHRHYGMPVADLIAEGNLGLLRALEKFNPDKGSRFGTYAAHWIRAYAVTHVLRSWTLVSGASEVLHSRLFFRLRRERARLESMCGAGAEANRMLAERLNVTEERLERMLERLDIREVSLEAPVHVDADIAFGDQLAAAEDTERVYTDRSVRTRIAPAIEDALATLSARERLIVETRWLAAENEGLSLAELGRKLGLSRERIRQIEARAHEKLRRTLTLRHGVTPEWLAALAA